MTLAEKRLELKKQSKLMLDAMKKISEVWLDIKDDDVIEVMSTNYPFKGCFIETTDDVRRWVNHIEEEMPEGYEFDQYECEHKHIEDNYCHDCGKRPMPNEMPDTSPAGEPC